MAVLGWVSRCDTATSSGDNGSATQGLGTRAPAVCAQLAQTPAEHKAYFYTFHNNYTGSVISSIADPLSCS